MNRFVLNIIILLSGMCLSSGIANAANAMSSSTDWMRFGMCASSVIPQPDVWCHNDTLSVRSHTYAIEPADHYTAFAVVRNPEPDSLQWLWCFAEDDTLVEAVHTQGIYTRKTRVQFSDAPYDFSRWSIYRYYSGCHSDSSKVRRLSLCSLGAFVADSAVTDTVHSRMEMKEAAYFSGSITRTASDMFLTYLAVKYGITLDYAPYISCGGDTLWHPDHDASYYHRITGIGNDTSRMWYAQKSFALDTAIWSLITDTLCPGEYVLMGDNDGTLYPSVQADGSYRLNREWMLRAHVKEPVSVKLELAVNALPDILYDSLWLIVTDADGLPRYTIPAEDIVPDSLCHFVLPAVDHTPLLLSLHGTAAKSEHQRTQQKTQQNNNVWYNAQEGVIEVAQSLQGKVCTAMLYDSTGKLIGSVRTQMPLSVRALPGNAYHIEIVTDGTIVGSITLPFNI